MKKLFWGLLRPIISKACPECGEVKINRWHTCCAFCDEGEGRVKP